VPVYWVDHFSISPELLAIISGSRKVCCLHNSSANLDTLPSPRFEYRRVLGEEVCVNDPALGIWSQDFNPVTCNLLTTTDQIKVEQEFIVSGSELRSLEQDWHLCHGFILSS